MKILKAKLNRKTRRNADIPNGKAYRKCFEILKETPRPKAKKRWVKTLKGIIGKYISTFQKTNL